MEWIDNTDGKVMSDIIVGRLSFLIYFLFGLSFFTSTSYLLDLPHLFWNVYGTLAFNMRADWCQLSPDGFKDEFFFDLGYFFGFSMTIFAMGAFFSTISPMVPILCFFSFFISFWIHKYNFLYVYEKQYSSDETFLCLVGYCSVIIIFARAFFAYIMLKDFGEGFERHAWFLIITEVALTLLHFIFHLFWKKDYKGRFELKSIKLDEKL
jgi:hypothetical protein